jgi:polysaccharide chain length determinant protein (PEP-CTERM system associated)
MELTLILKYIDVTFREAWKHRYICLLGFAVVAFVVLFMGMLRQSTFQTSATIFADNQNILKPLLQNQAEQSKIQNQVKVVQESLHSPRLLRKVVEQLHNVNEFESADVMGQKINALRKRIRIKGLGSGYIKISYSDSDSNAAYNTLNTVLDVFLKDASEEQRTETREAFLFIDGQVKQYKDQLVSAEERLKQFQAEDFDGGNQGVDARIGNLRASIEELRISIDEDSTTIADLANQLKNESQYSAKKFKSSVYVKRLEELESRMSGLLLTYTEDYPDVVSLKYQIDDIKATIKETEAEKAVSETGQEEQLSLNPLYQELRSRLSLVQTDKKAKQKRLAALNELLEREFDRRKRIAERGAELAELTRDYNVTKRIYEDMLARKEKARLSMTLNIEGQGVTYRIQEPPIPPLNPVGLRFVHYVMAGPFAASITSR